MIILLIILYILFLALAVCFALFVQYVAAYMHFILHCLSISHEHDFLISPYQEEKQDEISRMAK